jgi:hypothetical protein
MTFKFDPTAVIVVVDAVLLGPLDTVELRLFIDTGADMSVIRPGSMAAAGYDPSRASRQVAVTTAGGSGVTAEVYHVARLTSLGLGRDDFPIISYDLPPDIDIDGLLGLDFFAGHVLTLDFVNYTVSLT